MPCSFLKSYAFQKILHGNIIKVFCFIEALFPIKQKNAPAGADARKSVSSVCRQTFYQSHTDMINRENTFY
jgi:hypothetical protein